MRGKVCWIALAVAALGASVVAWRVMGGRGASPTDHAPLPQGAVAKGAPWAPPPSDPLAEFEKAHPIAERGNTYDPSTPKVTVILQATGEHRPLAPDTRAFMASYLAFLGASLPKAPGFFAAYDKEQRFITPSSSRQLWIPMGPEAPAGLVIQAQLRYFGSNVGRPMYFLVGFEVSPQTAGSPAVWRSSATATPADRPASSAAGKPADDASGIAEITMEHNECGTVTFRYKPARIAPEALSAALNFCTDCLAAPIFFDLEDCLDGEISDACHPSRVGDANFQRNAERIIEHNRQLLERLRAPVPPEVKRLQEEVVPELELDLWAAEERLARYRAIKPPGLPEARKNRLPSDADCKAVQEKLAKASTPEDRRQFAFEKWLHCGRRVRIFGAETYPSDRQRKDWDKFLNAYGIERDFQCD